jgi:hypothetical protein
MDAGITNRILQCGMQRRRSKKDGNFGARVVEHLRSTICRGENVREWLSRGNDCIRGVQEGHPNWRTKRSKPVKARNCGQTPHMPPWVSDSCGNCGEMK